jgi:hypothetical protein
VLAPCGGCEIGADVGGYPHINEACLEEGESLEEVGGGHGDGNGGAGGATPALAQQKVPVAMVDYDEMLF